MEFASDKPRSWYVFLAAVAAGFLIFVPLAVIGLNTKGIPMFLTGLTGAGIAWIVAAFLAMWLATRVAEGRYRDLKRAPWRDQLWALALVAAPLALALPQPAQAQYADALTFTELRDCMARDEAMIAREARLESWKLDSDREAEAIQRAAARLADEQARLDARDTAALAALNQRIAEQNRWVEAHNRRIADMNAATARVNADRSELTAACGRPFYPQDRDQILWERRTLR
jgi:hypothetical protein